MSATLVWVGLGGAFSAAAWARFGAVVLAHPWSPREPFSARWVRPAAVFFRGIRRGSRAWREAGIAIGSAAFFAFEAAHVAEGPPSSAAVSLLRVGSALLVATLAVASPRLRAVSRAEVAAVIALAVGVALGALPRLLGSTIGAASSEWSAVEVGVTGALAFALVTGRLFDPLGKLLLASVGDAGARGREALPGPSREALSLAPDLAVRFHEDGRLIVAGVLDPEVADVAAVAVRGCRTSRTTNSSYGASLGEYVFVPHADCTAPCAPMCRVAESLARGPLRDFVREVTGRAHLVNRSGAAFEPIAAVHALGPGDFLAPHRDADSGEHDGAAIVCVWHSNATWGPAAGGVLRFLDERTHAPLESAAPRYNELHVFAVPVLHDVTPVTGPEVRRTLNVRLYQPLEEDGAGQGR